MKKRFVTAIVCIAAGIGLLAVSFTVRHEAIRFLSAVGLLLFLTGSVMARRACRDQTEARRMDWYEATEKFHVLTFPHNGQLQSLPEDWQRELAALWRLEADVNNGAYLQFLENWGRESYSYASQALKKMGAHQMAAIIDRCQALVDEHFDQAGRPPEQGRFLAPNAVINLQGETIKEPGSVLPDEVIARIYKLSYEFMAYPDDLPTLGVRHYAALIKAGDGCAMD